MQQTVIVSRTEARNRLDAMRVALEKAPINYGLANIHAGSNGWRFTFERVSMPEQLDINRSTGG